MPPDVPEKIISTVKEVLNVPIITCKIYDTSLIGIFTTGNNNAIMLPKHFLAPDEEKEISNGLRENGIDLEVITIEAPRNALGNLLLINDKAALVSPLLGKEVAKFLSEKLGVEAKIGTIATSPLVGSLAVVTNKGLLVTPLATDEEVEALSEFFGVVAVVCTVNRGSPFLKSGLVANVYGALVGEETTGPELMRIQAILFQ